MPWLLHVVVQQREPTSAFDGGSDRSKRENVAAHVGRVLAVLWATLEPNVAASRRPGPAEGTEKLPLEPPAPDGSGEAEDVDQSSATESSDADAEDDPQDDCDEDNKAPLSVKGRPKTVSQISSSIVRQLVPMCFDVLDELVRLIARGERSGETLEADLDLWEAATDVVEVLKRACSYQDAMDKQRQSKGGNATSTVVIAANHADTTLQVGKFLEGNGRKEACANACEVLLHWKPRCERDW